MLDMFTFVINAVLTVNMHDTHIPILQRENRDLERSGNLLKVTQEKLFIFNVSQLATSLQS